MNVKVPPPSMGIGIPVPIAAPAVGILVGWQRLM
jgi:hypothetical protein